MWSFGWQDKLAEQTDWLKEKVDKLNIDMDDDWRRMLRQKK
jgi:hypothetical protein